MPEENVNSTETNLETNNQDSVNQQQSNEQTPAKDETVSTNYEELINTDKSLKSFVDKQITKATQSAVQNALQKHQRLTDEKLSEAEKLQVMTADEKAKYFEQKYKDLEKARVRDKEVESLKTQTNTMLSENKIPDIFLSVFDFDSATAEDIKQRVAMLSEYEYYPKGELDKRVAAALDDKLKQKTPETHTNNNNSNDLFIKGFDS